MSVLIQFTDEQAKELSNALLSVRDEGPEYEGWASAEVQELRKIVDDAIERKREPRCPICRTGTQQLGDALPAYSRRIGACGGLSDFELRWCRNPECGVLLSRKVQSGATTQP